MESAADNQQSEKSNSQKIWIFFAVAGVLIFVIKVLNKRTDFPCFYISGERFWNKENLYWVADEWPYKYPPVAAMLFTPLKMFSQNVAGFVFYVLSFLSMVFTYAIMLKVLIRENVGFSFYSFLLTFVLLIKFHAYDYANLQVNHFSLLFLVFAYYLYEKKGSTSSKWGAALLFSMGSIFKMIPFFVSAFYLLKKDIKHFLRILVAFVLFSLLPALWYGWDKFEQLVKSYRDLMGAHHEFFSPNGLFQSLPAMIARIGEYFQVKNVTIYSVALGLSLGLLALLILVMVYRSRKETESQKLLSWIEFSGSLVFYPLVNPVGWKHGYVFLMPAMFLAIHLVREKSLYKKWPYNFLIGSFVLSNIALSEFIIGKKLGNIKDLLSTHVLSAIALLLILFFIHREILSTKRSLT